MNKVEELEVKVRELEDSISKLKKEYRNQIYELDENNFSRAFLKKLDYKVEVKKEETPDEETPNEETPDEET